MSQQNAPARPSNNPFNRTPPGNQQNQQNQQSGGSRFSSPPPFRRFGSVQTTFQILSLTDTIVEFTLNGMGGAVARLLDDPNADDSIESIIEAARTDPDLRQRITERLNAEWAATPFTGAILVYDWADDLPQALAAQAEITGQKPRLLRAVDPLLTLNILGRARANILQHGTPLALERAYLNRTLISDDQRLSQLVISSGYLQETLPPLPKNEKQQEDDE